MTMTYSIAAQFAQTGGLVYFVLLFIAVASYALYPHNRARFEDAARIPLNEDD
jgi:cytochrome c oxidase cbb3-type subunit 4